MNLAATVRLGAEFHKGNKTGSQHEIRVVGKTETNQSALVLLGPDAEFPKLYQNCRMARMMIKSVLSNHSVGW